MSLIPYLSKESVPLRILGGPFRGARLILNPKMSKRKIVGAYEYVLNPWLSRVLPKTQVLWDVGANDGYFTYGCAHAMARHQKGGHVVAFEPGLADIPLLQEPAKWPEYSNVKFEFIPKFVGGESNSTTVTLDEVYASRPHVHGKNALVKVDVEGAEVDVIKAAESLAGPSNHWVVEVHGEHLLDPLLQFFKRHNRAVDVHYMKPHWLFGPEQRNKQTSWITTR